MLDYVSDKFMLVLYACVSRLYIPALHATWKLCVLVYVLYVCKEMQGYDIVSCRLDLILPRFLKIAVK